jgi:hypothetical protein
VPLPTLNANLNLIRNDSFSFDAKQSVDNSALLNISSKLYQGINMTTDIGYDDLKAFPSSTSTAATTASSTTTTSSTTATSSTTTTTQYIKGIIDATLTPKLFSVLSYGINDSTAAGVVTDTQQGSLSITYRPGKLINLSSSFNISEGGGTNTKTAGLLFDWLLLPAIKLNANYQYVDSTTSSGLSVSDVYNGYMNWYITKFMNLQLSYAYMQTRAATNAVTYSYGLHLSCTF